MPHTNNPSGSRKEEEERYAAEVRRIAKKIRDQADAKGISVVRANADYWSTLPDGHPDWIYQSGVNRALKIN